MSRSRTTPKVSAQLQQGLLAVADAAAEVMQRLGSAKPRFARAAQHYEIAVATEPESKLVTALT